LRVRQGLIRRPSHLSFHDDCHRCNHGDGENYRNDTTSSTSSEPSHFPPSVYLLRHDDRSRRVERSEDAFERDAKKRDAVNRIVSRPPSVRAAA
jgi:hypothetical protein